MTPNPPSMLGRAVAAVALTVGFYALALTLAGLLIAGPIASGCRRATATPG